MYWSLWVILALVTRLPRCIIKQNATSKPWLQYKPPKRQFLLVRDVHSDLVCYARNNTVNRPKHLVLAFAVDALRVCLIE